MQHFQMKDDRLTLGILTQIQLLKMRRGKCLDPIGRDLLEETIEDLILLLLEDILGRDADLSTDHDDMMMNELLIYLRDLYQMN